MLKSLKRLYHLTVAVIASIWFGFPAKELLVIGITGTDGKTTTATLLYEILKAAGYRTSMITSVQAIIADKIYDTGFHVTTPSAFQVQKYLRQALDYGDTHFVLEVTSHALDQYRVWGIPFRIGLITNITHEHLDWHGTMEQYRNTKLSLLTQSHTAVVNAADSMLVKAAKSLMDGHKLITFGFKKRDVQSKVLSFTTKLPGDFNIQNCLAALAASQELGIPKAIAQKAISSFSGVAGRMDVMQKTPFWVVIDFAHTPNAFSIALATVKSQTKGKLIHVFGCASERDTLKRPMMGEISARYADCIILTEEDYRKENVEKIMDEIASGIPPGSIVYRFANRQRAINKAISLARPGDTVMLTGKAHEKSLNRDGREYPWNEYEAVRSALQALKS